MVNSGNSEELWKPVDALYNVTQSEIAFGAQCWEVLQFRHCVMVGDGRIKKMSGGTSHAVQSEEMGGDWNVSRLRKGHNHRSRDRNENGMQLGTYNTTKIQMEPFKVVTCTTCLFTGPTVQLWTYAVSSFSETQTLIPSWETQTLLPLGSLSRASIFHHTLYIY